MEVAIQIQDQRATPDRGLVGIHPMGTVTGVGWAALPGLATSAVGAGTPLKIKADEKVATVLYDALKREFENNGQRVVDASDRAEWIIEVGLRKYWSEHKPDFWKLQAVGTVIADITIRNARNDSIVFSERVERVFIAYRYELRNMLGILATGLVSPFLFTFVMLLRTCTKRH
jgi:hypothetical protein